MFKVEDNGEFGFYLKKGRNPVKKKGRGGREGKRKGKSETSGGTKGLFLQIEKDPSFPLLEKNI